MMHISIIIPIYNTQEVKLRKCLDSILCQDYSDYECLMVDDGSEASTASLIDEYATKDNRFIAVHKENGGVSSARNKGLELAKGSWICFVDSDDWIKPNHLSSMVSAISDNVDIVLCGFDDVYIGKNKTHSYKGKNYIGKSGCRQFLSETDVLWYMMPWDRIFRSSIIEEYNIRFNTSLPISEDRLFCYDYLIHTRGIATINEITYVHDATDNTSLSRKAVPLNIQKTRYKFMTKAKQRIIDTFAMSKHDATMLNSYNENLLVTMLNSGGTFDTLLSLLQFDAKIIIKLLIKRIIHRCLNKQ